MSASFLMTAAWGLLVLAAFIGWGSAVERALFATRSADAGLRSAWGMAFALFSTALLSLASLAKKPVIIALVAIGVVLFLFETAWRARHARSKSGFVRRWGGPIFTSVVVLTIAAALLQYLASISDLRFNVNDDYIAYFPFAKQILQRGTLFDPFSTRLVMAFGGQSFLHAIVLAGAPYFRLHMFDAGICVIMSVLLVIGSRKDEEPAWPVVLALLLVITLPQVKINTHAQFSGIVFFYGLYRSILWAEDRERPRSAAALLALVATGACALRSNYLAVAIPLLAISYGYCVWKDAQHRAARIREASLAAAFGLLFLAPWMILAFRSAGTPLFPLVHGHFNNAFPMLQRPTNWQQEISDLHDTMTGIAFLPMFPLLALAALLVSDTACRKPLRALLFSTAIGWVLLVSALASDIPSFLRYVYGFVVALALATITSCAKPPRGNAARLAVAATLIAVMVQLALKTEHAIQFYSWQLDRLKATARFSLRTPETTPAGREYATLQKQVPAGDRLLVMVDFPYMLDFARNDIYNIDTAAAVSPPPGMPYFQGAESVARYLRSAGVRHLAFVRPERAVALYRRDVWEKELRGSQPLWHAQAPIFLDMFSNFDRLAHSYKVVYDDGTLVLLDLSAEAPTRPRA